MSQAMRRVMTVVLPVPAPAMMRRGPASCVTASRCVSFRRSRMRSTAIRLDYTTPRSTTDVRAAAEGLFDVTRRDERDVAPHRALECADGRADVHRLLELALLEHGPEESGNVGVAGADRIDHLDRRHVSRTVEAVAVEHPRARLSQLEAHPRPGRQPRQRLRRPPGRAGE